jgi:thiamine-phosphate pyrophosphorylase
MKNIGVCFVINESCSKEGIISDVNTAITAGARVIHYNEKKLRKRDVLENAYILSALCKKNDVLFIVEDYPDIAALVGADGVHLTQPDFSIEHVRRILGNEKYIGVQFHSLREAIDAEEKGADYISIGSHTEIFTKQAMDKLKKMKELLTMPIIAVGEFSLDQVKELWIAGVDGVAVMPGTDVQATTKMLV